MPIAYSPTAELVLRPKKIAPPSTTKFTPTVEKINTGRFYDMQSFEKEKQRDI